MEDGAIVEHGDHDELLAAGGAYHRLYMSQFRGEDAEEQFTTEVLAEAEAEPGAPLSEAAVADSLDAGSREERA